MATFTLQAARAQQNALNAKLIASLANQPNTPRLTRPTTAAYAADPASLRGIPAIGRNCPGRINGTNPEDAIQ